MDDAHRCTAHNSRGQRCGKPRVKGATVCATHGGSAPQVRRAAEVRAAKLDAHAKAERMVARAGVDADPIEHLLDSLHRAAALVEVWGQMVADLDNAAEVDVDGRPGAIRGEIGYRVADADSNDELNVVAADRMMALNRHGEAQVHPYVTEYQQALDRRAKYAKLAIDAGVEERRVEIEQEKGRQVAAVIQAVLADLGHDLAADDVRRVVGRHLRAVG